MELIIIVLLAIVLFKPIDRFIKGDEDLIFDRFSFVRKVFIIMTLGMAVLFIFALMMLIKDPSELYRTPAIVMGLLLLMFVFFLLWMRKLYQHYYEEDRYSFKIHGFFREKSLAFNEIKEMKYYRSGRGGSGILLRDFSGKKYNIPKGFFNHRLLIEYLTLNLKDHYTDHPNKWASLVEKREEIGVMYFVSYSELKQKIQNRITSTFCILFKPKVTKLAQGYLQRPSKVLLVCTIPLVILLIMILLGMVMEIRRSIQGVGQFFHGEGLAVLIIFIILFNVTFFSLLSFCKPVTLKMRSGPLPILVKKIRVSSMIVLKGLRLEIKE